MSNKEDLPSINDYLEDSNLPSYKDFIEEKHQLPSVEDYISESPKEEVLVEEQENIDPVLSETAPEWAELVRLVNDVRKNIPEIPEIKYYDTELCEISEKILQIEQDYVKSDKIDVLSVQNEEFEGKLSEIESKIPTVKYYDHDINTIYDKITDIKEEINNLPEVKYYEEDLKSLKSRIEQVNQDIPTFPDWIQEVQEVPDFSWIGKTFSLIDDDFNKVQGHIDLIKGKIDREVSAINESIEVKEFEFKVDVKNLNENLDLTNDRITQTKDKIYQEIKETSIRIWELRNTFKDDDKKLKKSILSEQNKLKQSLEKQIEKIDEQSVKADESILKFFNELKETVDTLPEVKYYDEDISSIKGDISSLKSGLKELNELSSLIKKDQKILKENYLLNEPPSEKEKAGGQTDALTPLDQKFATLDDLSNHYRLFINRITTQLSTMGGGGETQLKYLDDIVGIATNASAFDGKFLKYTHSIGKFEFVTVSGGGGGGSSGIEVLNSGSSVGTGITSINFSTNVTATASGSIATITASGGGGGGGDGISGITVREEGSVVGTSNSVRDINFVSNNLTAIASGVGATVTLSDTPTFTSAAVGSGVTINADGINVTGVVTATSFVGNVTGNADTATSLATARTFELTGDVVASQISFDGTGNVSLAATIQPNSVALGGDTTGDYVESISGTGNQITVTSGTGEGSTPVISIPNNPTLPGTTVTVATDLQVNRNLNVTGNVTIGGTSATLFTETLKISDPDIIVGFRTDAGGNDISNDTTASHGGIAVASTEGSPIVSFVGGGGTIPVTYKKIFWFESGAFTGLATDAWLTNYAFGVGTTSMSAGTKFAVGNIETDFDDITSVRHINSSGVVTATTFSGSGASLTSIPNGALTNSSIAIGGVTLNLGDTDATPAFNLSDATAYPYTSLTGITTEIVGDTTPQLGGNLDLNSKFITGTGGVNVTGVVTATSFVGSAANLTGLTGASAATYGDASNVAQIVVDADGRITGISEVTISGGGGGSSGIEIENNGTSVGTGITSINFSTNVTATASGGIATVTASGGGGGSSSFAIIDEVESFSTGGGSFTSGAWQDRDLNTVTYDDDDIIDLNSSTGEVTLKAAGTYKIDFRAPGNRCDYHVTRILDTSITFIRGRGSTAYSQDSGFYAQTNSMGSTIYTTTDVNQKFKLQHRCTTTQSSAVGMGGPHNVSAIGNNYYSQVIVTKLS